MQSKSTTTVSTIDHRSMKKSKSTSNLLKKMSPVKIEVGEPNEIPDEKSPSTMIKTNSPNVHRRRAKRSSTHHHSLLSTVSSVHELMSFVIYKDHPPQWLKQTDLYREYLNKSDQVHLEAQSIESWPHYHQQFQRKQRSNLHLFTRMDTNPSKINGLDVFTPLNVSIKQEMIEENSPSMKKKSQKRRSSGGSPRRRPEQVLCKKKLEENGSLPRRSRRARTTSVENQEPLEKKDSSSPSSQLDSLSSSSSSSIEHTSPSPTTTVSHRSSPLEYMRRERSSRLSSPLRMSSSLSPLPLPSSTPQRRSTRLWAPSSFYINPMWILPTVTSTKRNFSFTSSSSSSTESIKRPRRRCQS